MADETGFLGLRFDDGFLAVVARGLMLATGAAVFEAGLTAVVVRGLVLVASGF